MRIKYSPYQPVPCPTNQNIWLDGKFRGPHLRLSMPHKGSRTGASKLGPPPTLNLDPTRNRIDFQPVNRLDSI